MPNNPITKRANRPAPTPTSANKLVRGAPLARVVADVQTVPTSALPAGDLTPPGGVYDPLGSAAAVAALIPNYQFSQTITGLTGGGSTNLDGFPAGSLATGYVIDFIQTGAGRRSYQLQVSALTPGPLVVAAMGATGKQWISVL